FQAEDGIRDRNVTGVQTCALPISVKEKYTEISKQSAEHNGRSCCGAGGRSDEVYNIMTDDYSSVKGYSPDADLALGCGLPTQFRSEERRVGNEWRCEARGYR